MACCTAPVCSHDPSVLITNVPSSIRVEVPPIPSGYVMLRLRLPLASMPLTDVWVNVNIPRDEGWRHGQSRP